MRARPHRRSCRWLPYGMRAELLPHPQLELGARRRERQIERGALAGEVLAELGHGAGEGGIVTDQPLGRLIVATGAAEVATGQRGPVAGQDQIVDRRRDHGEPIGDLGGGDRGDHVDDGTPPAARSLAGIRRRGQSPRSSPDTVAEPSARNPEHLTDGGPMIEARGLTKRYGSDRGRRRPELPVRAGRVTGFLGPNGAGQVHHHADGARPGSRRPPAPSRIDGKRLLDLPRPMRQRRRPARRRLPAPHPQGPGPPLGAARRRTGSPASGSSDVLGLVGLSEVADKRVGEFSLGMKQRLGLAGALLGDPQIVLFDEPANGLDPEGILWIRQFMRRASPTQGRTVFVSSHLLSEMALIADDLVVIGKGELIFQGPVGSFIDGAAKTWVSVRSPQIEQLADALHRAGHQVTAAGPGAVDVVGTDVA